VCIVVAFLVEIRMIMGENVVRFLTANLPEK
jgi:hypothetical protein